MMKKILVASIILTVLLAGSGVSYALLGAPDTGSSLQKGLMAQWKFDGNARDATPNARHGTVTDATLTTDRKGQSNKAYSFDGSNDLITVTNTATTRPTSISISAWIKPSDTGTGRIVSRKVGGSPGSGYVLELNATLNPQFRISGAAADYSAVTADAIPQDSWSHVVATSDGTTMTLYINGVANGTPTTPVANINYTVTTTDISIGGLATLEFFAGSLSDVRIYNRALSTTEVTALYNSYK